MSNNFSVLSCNVLSTKSEKTVGLYRSECVLVNALATAKMDSSEKQTAAIIAAWSACRPPETDELIIPLSDECPHVASLVREKRFADIAWEDIGYSDIAFIHDLTDRASKTYYIGAALYRLASVESDDGISEAIKNTLRTSLFDMGFYKLLSKDMKNCVASVIGDNG